MSETMTMWLEISFNIAYLVVIWGLVITMVRRLPQLAQASQPLARLFILAFGLLALGDTGHVGFRVWAYALGSLEATVTLFGVPVGLVGVGALATAVTVTFFYMVMVAIWRTRFGRQYGWLAYLLFAAGVVRLVIMLFPANAWNSTVPPQPWSLYRNVPLMVQGLGVAYLILRDARAMEDRTFTWIGAMILTSFAFYLPVILFVQQVPPIGMLMIPKTLAYVAIAWLGYRELYAPAGVRPQISPQLPG